MSQNQTNRTNEDGFLIGALTAIIYEDVQRRVHEGYQTAGYGDLTPSHDPVFIFLSSEGDRIVDLSQRAGVSKQAMGYLVGYLEKGGYLERVPHPSDGRAQLVRRTERGWEVNRLARQLVQGIQSDWAKQIGQDRMEQLIILLRELASVIGVRYRGSISQLSHVTEEEDSSTS
jgi:DNA-binding MarR family transcriptional regulator